MSVPLAVIRYLAELDAALMNRAVADRDQIVQQISEHIDAALAEFGEPSDAEVAAVLADLGDPLVIAQESAGPAAHAPRPSVLASAVRAPIMTRPWVPLVAVIPFFIAEVESLVPLILGNLDAFQGLSTFTLLAVLLNIWWWASLAIVIISPLFRARAAVFLGTSLPVMALIVPPVARDLLDSPHTVDALFGYLVTFGLPIAIAAVTVLIAVRATRRAQTLAKPAALSQPA